MITLSSAAELLEKHGLKEGFIVGGIAEKGFSINDIDIIADAELPAPFHAITDSIEPHGPAIDIKKLNAVKKFLNVLKFMKPKKTTGASQEYYNLQDFKDFKGSYYIEPKWDGIRVAVARVGPAVLVRTDEGNFIEDKLPNIAEDIRRIPYDVVILDAELVVYIRGRRGDHSDVMAYLHSSSPPEDYHLKLKPFDVLYVDETDTRSKPLSERKQLIEKVPWSEFVHPVKFLKVDGSQVIRAIRSMSTSEGAMIKDADSTYNEAGTGWYKLKWQFTIDARVTAVEKKEVGYVYTCEAGGAIIGKTYATDKEAKEGDIIAVSVDRINKVEGGFTWYAPKVIGVRKDKIESDTAAVLERMAASCKAETNAVDPKQGQGAPVLEGPFVLHEHWWGEKHHFDLRFEKTNSEGKKVMIGFTLFTNSLDDFKSRLVDGGKILAKEKDYHAPEWLTFHGDIPPGQAGNPTKNLVAHMEIRDTGHYAFAKRESDFVDMILEGNILKGRYYVRKVALKDADEDPGSGPKPGDKQLDGQAAARETSQGGDNRWLFWKAKETKADSEDRVMFDDSMGIQIDASKLVDTRDGLLVKDAIICRAMVLDYQGKKVLKSPDALAESVPTVQRMMIVDEHPRSRVIMDVSEIKGRILPETIRLNDGIISGDLLITDKVLADKVRKGKRDLSPGYFADIVEKSGTFNNEPYEAVQEKVLYDHLAVVKLGRCSRPRCGIVDSIDSEADYMKELETIPEEITDGIEKDLGKLHEVAAGLQPKDRELVGRFVEGINNLLLMIHRMNSLMQEMPKEKHPGMVKIIRSVTKSMMAMHGAAGEQTLPANNSNSSIIDEEKEKEIQKTMAESIVIDGVGYTPEMVKKLVADSAALSDAQKTATETKKLLDAKEAAFAEQGKILEANEARIATIQAQIDAMEQERRTPLIKQITDAMPALKAEDLKTWDFKRLTDTAASVLEAEKLKMKNGAKPSKSIIDDAYAKVGEK